MPATMRGADMIAYMDRGGVDRALCAPPAWALPTTLPPTTSASRKPSLTIRTASTALRASSRRGVQAAIDEMHHWLQERTFHAVKFNTIDASTYGAGCYSLADRALMNPFLEAIAALQVPVMIHTGEEHGHTCTPALVANLALDFPHITLIIAHAGVPGFLDEVVPFMQRAENTAGRSGGRPQAHLRAETGGRRRRREGAQRHQRAPHAHRVRARNSSNATAASSLPPNATLSFGAMPCACCN